jgi:putative ABC transport system permease protein
MRELFAFLPYVFRTASRARMRSLLTLLGAALAMGLFAFVRTVDDGVAALATKAQRPVLVVFQDSRFCPLTSELPLRYADAIRAIPDVVEVLPTLVFINSCRSNLDLVTLHGVVPERMPTLYDFDLLSGSVSDWQQRRDGALVGERLASRRGLAPGQRVRLGEVDLHISGVLKSQTAGVDNLAFVHLDPLALSRKRQGTATQFLVKIRDGADPEAVAAAIDATFRGDEARTDTKGMQAFVAAAIAEIAQVVDFARWLGYLAVLVVALVLANTVFISAEARRNEFGVLQTIGLRSPTRIGLVAAEGILLGIVGGGLGMAIVLGLLRANALTLGVEGFGIDLLPSLTTVVHCLVATVVVAVAASLPPALFAGSGPLATAIKDE